MSTRVKAIKKEEDFYEVAAIVIGLDGGIPLIEEYDLWRLPSRWSRKGEYPELTLLYGVNSEIGIVVKYPEREVFRKKISAGEEEEFDFIVFAAEYFTGNPRSHFKEDVDIFRVEQFNSSQIIQMIKGEEILPDHAEALMKYINYVYRQSF